MSSFDSRDDAASASGPEPTRLQVAESSASALVSVLDQYLADLQAGQKPDRSQLLADHPELAPQLEECLDGIEFVHRTSHADNDTPTELGDFRIVREVGRGGMGVVYEAEQLSLRRRVALKVLRFGGVADEEAVQRFQREAETVASLDHGNIVPVYAVGSEAGVHYYAMQFIEGESLAGHARQSGHSPVQIAEWGLSAADALAHAHRQGVVHRDVKPSNLILDEDRRLWLTDFGLARRDIDVTLSVAGALLGTPRYMSPEQAAASKKPVDHRTDIYSLGASLYELATGKPVFDAETPQGVITQILNAAPRDPRNLDPELPRDLETIILTCLEKDAADRYATAADLADDLRAFLEDRPIRARRPTLVERGAQTLRRHRRVATAAAVSTVVAAVIVVASFVGTRYVAESRLGEASFFTSGPRMVGEIVDAKGKTVVPDFAVPTIDSIKLPEGDYSVRLSADGLLSETWPLEVTRGTQTAHSVRFRSRWLWPPKELDPDPLTVVDVMETRFTLRNANSDSRSSVAQHDRSAADLLVVTHEHNSDQGLRQTRVGRIDGRTGKSTWPNDLVLRVGTCPDGREKDGWAQLLSDSGVSGHDFRRLVKPSVDLDGDGITDPVFAARGTPSLLALRGADGTLLWWYRGRPNLSDGRLPTRADGSWDVARGGVVGTPVLSDVDSDGTLDFVACFHSRASRFRWKTGDSETASELSWVEAISGRTGKPMWRHPVSSSFGSRLTDSEDAERLHHGCTMNVANVVGKRIAVAIAGRQLIGFDVTNGATVWPPLDLGKSVFRAPVCRDFSGDGNDELLVIHWSNDEDDGRIRVVDLVGLLSGDSSRATTWQHPLRPTERVDDLREAGSDWISIDDLDENGSSEIVVATGRYDLASGWNAEPRFSGVELLDGSGNTRWARRLTVTERNTPPSIDRITTGPDLNGDGWKDVFAAWVGATGPNVWEDQSAIKVVALSGKDGQTLWRWMDPVGRSYQNNHRGEPLTWWQPGTDGWPLLVVVVRAARGGQDATYFLEASTGRLAHTLSGVSDPKIADFNGDGIVDLFYRVSPQGAPRMLVIAGSTPEPWKRLGAWQPIRDVDDDEIDDFLRTTGSTVASGSDGRILWRATSHLDGRRKNQLAPPLPDGDVDGDGAGDLFTFRASSHFRGRSTEPGINVYSGRTGRLIRRAVGDISLNGSGSGSRYNWSYDYPYLAWTDLDGDRRAEALSVTMSREESLGRWVLSAWSDDDEAGLIWQRFVLAGTIGAAPDPYRLDKWVDINGDGTDDLVIWAKRESADGAATAADRKNLFVLQAVSGHDGATLWSSSEFAAAAERDVLWPRPAVGDIDGDDLPEVVLGMTKPDRRTGDRQFRLIVLDASSGQLRWSYEWAGDFDFLPPLLLDFDGNGTQTICVGLKEADAAFSILLLDPDGSVRERLSLDTKGRRADRVPLWMARDVDGASGEELLFRRDGHLVCTRGGEQDVVWTWPLPDVGNSAIVAEGFEVRTGEVVVWSGQTVYGLDSSTGHVRWRCEGDLKPRRQSSQAPGVRLLTGPHNATLPNGIALPHILFHGDDYHQSFATIVRQAVGVRADGTPQLPTPHARDYERLGEEPRAKQPLPWMNAREPSLFQHIECLAIPIGATMLMVMVPVWIVRATLQAKSRLTATLLILALCSSVAFGTLGPFAQAASNVIAFALPGLLLIRWWSERDARDLILAIASTVLLALPIIVLHRTPHPLAATNAWGEWYWLDELLLERLSLGLVAGLPGYVYWRTLVGAMRRSDRVQVRRLLVWPSALAIVIAAVILGLDTRLDSNAFRYSWNGWYIIWFWGMFVVGLGVAIRMTLETIVSWKTRKAAATA